MKNYVVVKLISNGANGFDWQIVDTNTIGILVKKQAEFIADEKNNSAFYSNPNLHIAIAESTWQKYLAQAPALVKARKAYTDKLADEKKAEENAVPCDTPKPDELNNIFRSFQQVRVFETPYIFYSGAFRKDKGEECDKTIVPMEVRGILDEHLNVQFADSPKDKWFPIVDSVRQGEYIVFVIDEPLACYKIHQPKAEENAVPCSVEEPIPSNRFKLNQQVQIVGTPYIFAKNHGSFMQNTGQHCDKVVEAEVVEAEQNADGMLDIKHSNYYGAVQLEIVATKNCADCDFYVCYQPLSLEYDLVIYMVLQKPEEESLKTLQMQPTMDFFNAKLAEKSIMDILYPAGVPTVPDCDFCDTVLAWTKVDVRLQPLQNILCGAICDFMEAQEEAYHAEAKRRAEEQAAEAARIEQERLEHAKRYTRMAEIIAETKKTMPFASEATLSAIAAERYDYELKAEAERLKRLSPKEAEAYQKNMPREKNRFGSRQERKESFKESFKAKRMSAEEATCSTSTIEAAAELLVQFVESDIKSRKQDRIAIKANIIEALQERADWALEKYTEKDSVRNESLCATKTVGILVEMLRSISEPETELYINDFMKGKNILEGLNAISDYLSCKDLGKLAFNEAEALERYNEAKKLFIPNIDLIEPVLGHGRFNHAILTLSNLFREFFRLCEILQSKKCELKGGRGRIIDLFR